MLNGEADQHARSETDFKPRRIETANLSQLGKPIFLPPPEASQLRQWALLVASELELPEDWLNDGAKGFLNGLTIGPLLLSAPGIQVHQVTAEQLLAMKLSAWRDDTDINDARRLLLEFPNLALEALWTTIEPFVIRGEELKARYALEDLWNARQT